MVAIIPVPESIIVKKLEDDLILLEFVHFYGDDELDETQARTAVAQIHDMLVAEPSKQFTFLVRLAPEKEVRTTLDSNRAYLDIILHKQVRKIAIIFDAQKHSRSVKFVVDVFQKLTDKIRVFTQEDEGRVWLKV